MKRSSIIPALAYLLAASPLAAQVKTTPETIAGRKALSLDVGGGYVVGLWQHAAAAVAPGALAHAQEAADTTAAIPRTPQKGARSLSFAAPGYAGGERAQFGIWEMVGRRTNLGLTLDLSLTGRDRETDGEDITEAGTFVGLGANLRRYLGPERAVKPFLQGGVFGRGGYSRRDGDNYEESTRSAQAGVEGGVGVEWFPVPQFSVSGFTGARLSLSRYHQDYTDPNDVEHTSTWNEGGFQTLTSALSVQIYF